MPEINVRVGTPSDAGELLTLQRAAYVSEAQLYGTVDLPPLTQTLDEIEAELQQVISLVAVDGERIIGGVRIDVVGVVGRVDRLVVAPDWQGQGVGTRLVECAEAAAPPEVERFELFTGHRSSANQALYTRLGYSIFRRERLDARITLVHMAKARR